MSREDAQRKADDRVREVADKVRAGQQLKRYGYGDRPLREEITQSVDNAAGLGQARGQPGRSACGAHCRLGQPPPRRRSADLSGGRRDAVLDHQPDFEPTRSESLEILRDFQSDPLYVRLCQAQDCFRARLTPKPWRCNMPLPPVRYPWENYAVEVKYRQWEQRYEQASQWYSVCELIKHIGPQDVHPDVAAILALHDRLTGVGADRPLA